MFSNCYLTVSNKSLYKILKKDVSHILTHWLLYQNGEKVRMQIEGYCSILDLIFFLVCIFFVLVACFTPIAFFWGGGEYGGKVRMTFFELNCLARLKGCNSTPTWVLTHSKIGFRNNSNLSIFFFLGKWTL